MSFDRDERAEIRDREPPLRERGRFERYIDR